MLYPLNISIGLENDATTHNAIVYVHMCIQDGGYKLTFCTTVKTFVYFFRRLFLMLFCLLLLFL